MPELTLTIPNQWWLTSNQRMHWAAKHRRTRYIRDLAATYARVARLGTHERVHVCAWIGYPKAGKADPSNAAPTIKAVLDGLTDAGVWTDDDSDHVVAVEYRRETTKAPPGTHTVRLTITNQTVPFAPAAAETEETR